MIAVGYPTPCGCPASEGTASTNCTRVALCRRSTATRRRQLAEALWRVVLRDGIESASVRKVAAEAGLSAGSLRHVFPSQSELLTFAMQLIVEEVRRRLEEVEPSEEIGSRVERRLQSLLVLDPETRAVFDVWLAFAARARVDPNLRPLRDQTHAQVRELCRAAVETLRSRGPDRPSSDDALETDDSMLSSTGSRCTPRSILRPRRRPGRSRSSRDTSTASRSDRSARYPQRVAQCRRSGAASPPARRASSRRSRANDLACTFAGQDPVHDCGNAVHEHVDDAVGELVRLERRSTLAVAVGRKDDDVSTSAGLQDASI